MLSSLKFHDRKREEGFTLIELLVVVIIIGILAAIAIPVFLNQRERAWRTAVESDLRNAAIQMESYFTDNTEYPDSTIYADTPTDATTTAVEGALDGFRASDNVTMTIVTAGNPGFCLEAVHANLPVNTAVVEEGNVFHYDTRSTGDQSPVPGGCA